VSIFVIEYLREYEAKYETVLAHESVDPGVLFHEETRGRKYMRGIKYMRKERNL
jgi:hypothetical protein